MTRHLVIQCKNCGRWSRQDTKKKIRDTVFTCKYQNCAKISHLYTQEARGIALRYHEVDHPLRAAELCKELNGQRAGTLQTNIDTFATFAL